MNFPKLTILFGSAVDDASNMFLIINCRRPPISLRADFSISCDESLFQRYVGIRYYCTLQIIESSKEHMFMLHFSPGRIHTQPPITLQFVFLVWLKKQSTLLREILAAPRDRTCNLFDIHSQNHSILLNNLLYIRQSLCSKLIWIARGAGCSLYLRRSRPEFDYSSRSITDHFRIFIDVAPACRKRAVQCFTY